MQAGETTPLMRSESGLTDCRKRASTDLTLRSFQLPAAVFAVLTAALLMVGVRRSLTADEAAFLLRVPDRAAVQLDGATARVRIQAAWASVAGSMERPARFLSVLCTMVGLGLLGINLTRLLDGKSAAVGMLALGALPQFFSSGAGIGSDALLFCIVCTMSFVVMGWRTAALSIAACVGLLAVAWDEWPSLILTASPIVVGLLAVGWKRLTPNAQRITTLAACLAIVFHVVAGTGKSNEPHAERLDWIRTHIDPRATLLIQGPDRHITRYLQTAHHRTGHNTVIVEPDEDLTSLSRRLYLNRHPLLVVLGSDKRLDASLALHFRGEDIHDGVRIFRLGQ